MPLVVLTLLFLNFLAPPLCAEEAAYHLIFDQKDFKRITVEATLTAADSSLKMIDWGYPSQLERGWAEFVRDLQVSHHGQALVPVPVAGGGWKVAVADGSPLQLRYTVEISHDRYNWDEGGGNDSRPAIVGNTLFCITKALFIYAGPDSLPATVKITAPADWRFSTPWTPDPQQPGAWRCRDLYHLADNVVVIGQQSQRIIQDGNMQIILAIDPAMDQDFPMISDILARQLGAYRKIFGQTPAARYLIALRRDPQDDGEAFNDSFIQVFANADLPHHKIGWANTFGHELFHYWNGAGRIQGADWRATQWFTEGFTDYFSSLVLARNGIIPEEVWFKKLERYFARYWVMYNKFPEGRLSLAEAGKDKNRNWLLVYGGGATLAFLLDVQMRQRSGGEVGLDRVMRLMDERFGESQRGFTLEDFIAVVDEASGPGLESFIRTYVEGNTQMPPVAEIARRIGLNVTQFADEFYITRHPQAGETETKLLNGLLWRE